MAKFTSTKVINSRWRNNDFVGGVNSTHTFSDPLYDEFLVDWDLQIADGSIVITETPTTGNIQMSTLTVGDIVLTGTATGNFGTGGGGTTVIGTSPISVVTASNTATVSLNASYSTSTHLHTGTYQPSGTYVTSVAGTSPISTSGTTAITVAIDQTALSAAAATSALNLRTLVRNTTASTIAKGSVVYLASSNGTIPTIEKALATSDATSARTFGLVEADITANSNGYVLNQGIFDPINTSGIADGAILWLSATVAGAYSTVKPTGPNHGVLVGVCVKGTSVGAGSIYVFIKNGSELDEIHDVNISSLLDGQALIYNTAQSVWINQALATASTSGYGYTTLVDSVASTSTTVAATANAARIANAAGTAAQITANAATVSAAAAQTTANARVATVAGDAAIGSTGTTAISLAHTTTDGYHHVPATSTTNSGKFLKAGATAGSEAWTAVAMSDITTGAYIATATGSTGVTITGSGGNAGAAVVSIGQAVATTSNVTFVNVTGSGIISASNISSGSVDITPVANATTGVAVTGLTVKTSAATATAANASVLVTAVSAADPFRSSSYSSATFSGSNLTGFTVNIFRTNTTVTSVNWLAIGR
jgi:hypothetical protein